MSATVSTIEMFQSVIRLSTISIAATTKSVARRRRSRSPAGRADRSSARTPPRPRRAAASVGFAAPARRRRWPCRRTAHRSPGRSTPNICCTTGEVNPILRPTRRAPTRVELDHPLLHGVRVVDRAVRQQVDDRVARNAARRGVDQALRRSLDRVMLGGTLARSVDLGRIGIGFRPGSDRDRQRDRSVGQHHSTLGALGGGVNLCPQNAPWVIS